MNGNDLITMEPQILGRAQALKGTRAAKDEYLEMRRVKTS